MTDIGNFVRSQGYRPSLRPDLRFYREAGKDLVVIHDPVRGRRYEMYENECLIAREMNGARDLEELTRIARKYIPSATRSQIEGLAAQIAGMGFLSNIPDVLLARPSAPQLAVPMPENGSEGLEDWTMLSDGKELAEPEPEADDGQTELAAADVVDPEPVAEPEPEPEPMAAEEVPAEPAGEAWEVEQSTWFQRHKKLAYTGVVLVVILALSLIPYPLYITEPCAVRPVARAEVRSQIEGIIAEVLVNEGDEVKVGAPLAKLDDRDLVYAMDQATATVDRLTAALAKVRTGNRPEEIRRSKALLQSREQDVRYAAIEATRQAKLFKQDVASAAQRDEAARNLAVKQSAAEQAAAELKLIQSGSRSEEVSIAEADLKRAQAEVIFLKKKMDLLVIRSPIAGRVLTPRFNERIHARLAAGDELCEIGSLGSMLVEISVDEAEADVIRVGEPVKVKVRSFPLETFEGTVGAIASAVTADTDRRVLRVDAIVSNPSNLLQPRMTGYAEIDAGKQTIMRRAMRRAVRWIRVRFLI